MTMGLDRLRSQLTVIPQDPVMFSGSIRFNLDPFHKNSDGEIWEALDRAQLKKDVLEKFPNKLNHVITENGDNLSVGQKQLMCIARALLRKSKIIVLDEATASIDSVTDQMLQKTVRTEFHNCTVLTIAHRIDTVLDYDRILVLDNGQVAEYDTPGSLLERKNGLFKLLVDKLHCPV
ncbi:ABCC1 [Symbiodinium microadriaticum]|nr:ABCC1 [Symbiodinium microadriaticum]